MHTHMYALTHTHTHTHTRRSTGTRPFAAAKARESFAYSDKIGVANCTAGRAKSTL